MLGINELCVYLGVNEGQLTPDNAALPCLPRCLKTSCHTSTPAKQDHTGESHNWYASVQPKTQF